MVGAGIFALLGEAAILAGSAVWLSFLAAGIIALLTGYSFTRLGVRYPSRGGIVEYLVQAYGTGWFSGGCSILFYITQLIGMSMIALAFGKYAARLFGVSGDLHLWERVLASGLIVALVLLNLVGSELVSKVQKVVVIANLALLSAFTLGLSPFFQSSHLAVGTWPAATPILGSMALTFFAFTGFAVVSNAAEDMKNPSQDLPRAMYSTILIVIVLYVALALMVAGAASADKLTSAGPMLLAEAARGAFGDIGFNVLLVSAVVSTVTCINGGLFGVTCISYTLAEKGELPARFMQEIRASTRGLTISAALVLVMVNFMTLMTVVSIGSATSLLVYSLVNYGAFRVLRDTDANRILISLSVLACAVAIAVWLIYTFRNSPGSLAIFFSFLVAAFVAEGLLQRFRRRRIRSQKHWGASPA